MLGGFVTDMARSAHALKQVAVCAPASVTDAGIAPGLDDQATVRGGGDLIPLTSQEAGKGFGAGVR